MGKIVFRAFQIIVMCALAFVWFGFWGMLFIGSIVEMFLHGFSGMIMFTLFGFIGLGLPIAYIGDKLSWGSGE